MFYIKHIDFPSLLSGCPGFTYMMERMNFLKNSNLKNQLGEEEAISALET